MDQSWQHRPLPPNWEAKYDPGLARYFYVNHATRSTQWIDPRIKYYANQHNMAQNIPMTVMVKPKCSTCRTVEVSRAGQDCGQCMFKKQQKENSARIARENEARRAEAKKKREEAEKKKREETEKRRREEAAKVRAEENRLKAEAAKPKKPTEAMKRDAKRKLTQQFPKVSNLMIDMAIETTNCDVTKAAGVLRMLANDEPRTTPKTAKGKKSTDAKKSSPKKKPSQPAPSSAASRGVSPSGVSFEVLLDTVLGSSVASSSTTPQPASVTTRPVEQPKRTSPKKMKGADGRVKFAPVVIKSQAKTFNSSLAVGPDASLVVGHNVDLLIDKYVTEKGQDTEIRNGPNPAFITGPNRHLTNKENMAVGPDPSHANGPQMLLYQGPMSSGTAI